MICISLFFEAFIVFSNFKKKFHSCNTSDVIINVYPQIFRILSYLLTKGFLICLPKNTNIKSLNILSIHSMLHKGSRFCFLCSSFPKVAIITTETAMHVHVHMRVCEHTHEGGRGREKETFSELY